MSSAPLAVLFDLDGVLIDSERLHYAAWSQVLGEFDVSVSPEVYGHRFIALGTGAAWATKEFSLPVPAAELVARKRPIVHRLLREQVELMPGALATVGALAAEFPLAVATNSPQRDLDLVVTRFELGRYFRALLGREAYTAPKPAPDAYLAAADKLGVPIERCLVVEDSQKGVDAGHAAGAWVVAIPHQLTAGNDFSHADVVLERLADLTPAFARQAFPTPRS